MQPVRRIGRRIACGAQAGGALVTLAASGHALHGPVDHMNTAPPPVAGAPWSARFAPLVRAFHAYGNWLVSISWKRFFLLSLLLLICGEVLQDLPPFSWRISETVEVRPPRIVAAPTPPKTGRPKGEDSSSQGEVEISIGRHGIRITPNAGKAASAAQAAASAAKAAERAVARRSIQESIQQAREDAAEARRDAEAARRDAERAAADLSEMGDAPRTVVRHTKLGEPLPELAFFWIFASMIMKITYKGQLKAQAQAAQATEVAESEQLKRQVVEARMAAMQAQVEPHFLFNTLASIDHLIETDPARASTMQKNLIALLRASMPTMREASNGGPRDLGREMAVIRPYLEILKVRMEERLATRIDVPDGLLSAEFPSMMIQSLVENAIKHGLEPKPEGGELAIRAEIVHGKLEITVADTGLGFGKAATAGTGVGLANIRERLALLYGEKATLNVTENRPTGTVVKITVPYTSRNNGAGPTQSRTMAP